VIYPSERGWDKIYEAIKEAYHLSADEAMAWVNKKRTKDNGFEEQLWTIMQDHHEMFYNGTDCLKSTEMKLIGDI
jgi:hypothetical protein